MPSRVGADRLAGAQLPVGGPLHEFDEFDLGGVRALAQLQRIWHRRVAATPPAIPTTACRICAGAPRSRQSATTAAPRSARNFSKSCLAPGVALALKAANAARSARHFSPATRDIVDDHRLPATRASASLVSASGGNSGMLLDVDIERVEKQPAVRRIGAAIAGPIVEQGMQRIEADAVGAEMVRELDQAGEIGEIAHAPVARRADAVELDREQPAAVEIAAKGPLPAPKSAARLRWSRPRRVSCSR